MEIGSCAGMEGTLLAEKTDFSAVRLQKAEDGTQRCGFSCAVGAHKTGDTALGYGKACLGQGEARIFLGKIINFYDIFHGRQLLSQDGGT